MTGSATPASAAVTIANLASHAYRLPMPVPWGPGRDSQQLIVTVLESSAGATGTGFSWTVDAGAQAVKALLDADVRRLAAGLPVDPVIAWERLHADLGETGSGITSLALAAVDIALWDLRARNAGVGLPDLLGRRRQQVPAYASGVNRHLTLDELTEQVTRWVKAGHSRVKIKVGLPSLDDDVERVAAVRRIIGPRRLLMVDANQRWDLPAARRAAGALASFDIFWLEEPLPADDTRGYARLRARTDIPIAAGESLWTEAQFRDLLLAEGADFVQPNVCRVGGITPFLRIASLADAFGVPVMPHLLPDLSGQLATCLPRRAFVEDIDHGSFEALGALAQHSGVVIEGDSLTASPSRGHGLVFASEQMHEISC